MQDNISLAADLLPIPPAPSPAALIVSSSRGKSTASALGSASVIVVSTAATGTTASSTGKSTASAGRGCFVVDKRERRFVLDVEVCEGAGGSTAECLSSVAPPATRSAAARILGLRKAYRRLAIVSGRVIPVRKASEFIRFRVRRIRNILELELVRKIRC